MKSGVGVVARETYSFETMKWTVHLKVSVPRPNSDDFYPPLEFHEPSGVFPSDELVTQLMLLT
jgi:hypothetical protein